MADLTATSSTVVDSSASIEEVVPAVTKSQLNKAHHAERPYGNYHNYYWHRAPVVPDGRLSLLPPSLFQGRSVLDLGCNAGKLTREVVEHLAASSSLGIDIDEYLVKQAIELSSTPFVSSSSSTPTSTPSPSPGHAPIPTSAAPDNVQFQQGDFMQDPSTFFTALKKKCDTVLLLSITKWLHLQHGDEGLRRLFVALFEYLPAGHGTLVVEPQEWDNYKTAVKKNKSLRPVFKTLEMRPPFEEDLKAVGFRLMETIEREEGGFSRPLLVWSKP